MRIRGKAGSGGAALLVSVTALSVALEDPDPASARRDYECKKGVQFVKKPAKRFKRTETAQRNENRASSGNVRATFKSRRTRTVKQQIDAGGEISGGAVFASAKASFNYSIAKETTAEIGNEISTTMRPRTAVLARYGVYTYKFEGAYYAEGGRGLTPTPGCKYHFQYEVTAVIPRDTAGWVLTRRRLR